MKCWAAGVLLIELAGCSRNTGGPLKFPLERTEARSARGKYLVEGIMACFDCHSDTDWSAPDAPPKPGKTGGGQVFPMDGLPG